MPRDGAAVVSAIKSTIFTVKHLGVAKSHKQCDQCGLLLKIQKFDRDGRSPDGRVRTCRKCRRNNHALDNTRNV